MDIISTKEIESTYTFIMLGESNKNHPVLNNKMQQQMLLKRKSREQITHCITVWQNTGVLQPTLTKYQLAIFYELIEAKVDENLKSKENTNI